MSIHDGKSALVGRVPGVDLGKCPFCDGRIAASTMTYEAFHTMPFCARWLACGDALDFIVAVRRARDIPDESEPS